MKTPVILLSVVVIFYAGCATSPLGRSNEADRAWDNLKARDVGNKVQGAPENFDQVLGGAATREEPITFMWDIQVVSHGDNPPPELIAEFENRARRVLSPVDRWGLMETTRRDAAMIVIHARVRYNMTMDLPFFRFSETFVYRLEETDRGLILAEDTFFFDWVNSGEHEGEVVLRAEWDSEE